MDCFVDAGIMGEALRSQVGEGLSERSGKEEWGSFKGRYWLRWKVVNARYVLRSKVAKSQGGLGRKSVFARYRAEACYACATRRVDVEEKRECARWRMCRRRSGAQCYAIGNRVPR